MTDKFVTIRSGDTLAKLADKHIGNISAFRDIADANNIDIFGDLPTDTTIRIPIPDKLTSNRSSLSASQLTSSSRSLSVTQLTSSLDLSSLKQPNALADTQLTSWIL